MVGARTVVFLLFLVLGLTFLAETALLAWEFRDASWLTLATHDSHLFLFFPTLGLVALAAFYVPAVALVDMYFNHTRWGAARFLFGLSLVALASLTVGAGLASSPYRSIWDIKPAVLKADKSQPPGCGAPEKPCERIRLLDGVENLATVSRSRLGLKEFIRSCAPEPLIESEPTMERRRFCFASTPLSDAPKLSTTPECCRAQQAFQQAIGDYYVDAKNRSTTGVVHAALLPLKVFFLLVLLSIGILLALRHDDVMRHYPHLLARIEVAIIVGAVAMLFFPLMSQGFVQTADALYGVTQDAGFKPIVHFMTFLFALWSLLLLLFFFRRRNPHIELAVKLAGVVASMIAVVKYDLIISLFTRFLGSGSTEVSVAMLAILAVAAFLVLTSRRAQRIAEQSPALSPIPPAGGTPVP